MKYIKLFENYNDIESICKKYGINNYNINEDGSVDVDSDVLLYARRLSKLPIKFGKVNGDFDCGKNNLTTLKGSPEYVNGSFHCNINKLTTLKDCTKYIGGDFNCSDNDLITLKYFPEINGNIYIHYNKLPKEIYNNIQYIKDIIKYQDEYRIWNKDDSLNINRFNVMMGEIKDN